MLMLLKTVGSAILDFIYPQICVACEKQITEAESAICIKCLWDLPRTNSHIDNALKSKFVGKIEIKNTFSYLKFDKKGHVQNILHALKYKNNPELAELIGLWYGKDLVDVYELQKYDYLVPIPLHKDRFKERGYNQAFHFALGLSEALNLPVNQEFLVRTKNAISQTKTTNRIERFRNIENAYSILDTEKRLLNKKVIIVDDVLTTGSTLEIVGNLLLNAGVEEISVITIAAAY